MPLLGDNQQGGAPGLEVIDEDGHARPPPDRFIADIGGRPVEVRRLSEHEADDLAQDQNVEREDHWQEAETGSLRASNTQTRPQQTHTDSYRSTLPSLKEVETGESAQTEAEKQEIQNRQEEELNEYYNNYRNALARFRARYPEAPAEFLAVSSFAMSIEVSLTFRRPLYMSSSGLLAAFMLLHSQQQKVTIQHKPGHGAWRLLLEYM
jgi:hypothetical protein